MSISLNDHENRIKALENIKTKSSLTKELVYSGSTSDSVAIPNLSKYDAVYILVQETCDLGGGDLAIITPEFYNISIPMNHVNAHAKEAIKIDSANKKCVWTCNQRGVINKIYGLNWGGGINLGTLLKRFLVYIKTYSKLFHLQFLEVK